MAKKARGSTQPVVPVDVVRLKQSIPDYVENFDGVLMAEHLAIAERRDHVVRGSGENLCRRVDDFDSGMRASLSGVRLQSEDAESYSVSGVKDTVGVALSGGGIRSAAFCTGALQALAKNDVLQKVDYLSTVSGGGYAGISTVLALNKNEGEYPFFKSEEIKDTADMGTLRDNANYLRMGDGWAMLKNIAIVAKGLVTNFLLVASFMLFVAAFTLFAKPTIPDLCQPSFHFLTIFKTTKCAPYSLYLASVVSLAVYVTIIAIWAVWASVGRRFENLRGIFVNLVACGLTMVLVVIFCDLQPHLVRNMIPETYFTNVAVAPVCPMTPDALAKMKAAGNGRGDPCAVSSDAVEKSSDAETTDKEKSGFNRLVSWLQTIVAPLIALIALASKQLGDLFKTNEQETGITVVLKKITGRLVVWGVALTLPLVMWAGYLGLVYWGIGDGEVGLRLTYPFAPEWLLGAMQRFPGRDNFLYAFSSFYFFLGVALLLVWFFTLIDPNANSLFGLYRARLKDAFCKPWSVESGKRADLKISDLDAKYAPLLIINAALNVQASKKVNSRGRNADFFSFTPEFVGSKATGYARTSAFEKLEKQIDLASGMAISGAAVSSNMGSQSMRPMTATLALLNARLGAWLLNPKVLTKDETSKPSRTPFFYLAELFGQLTEEKRSVYLTDGGHIENLGIYELLRRRCKIIIAIDAEADREMNFSSLITLQRYARIDLGTRIKLPRSAIASRSKDAQKSDGKSANGPHCAIGKIEYNKVDHGILVYVKASVTGDENDYIRDYNRRFRDYPHETTGDQFFSEEQFEVYRALGFHSVDEMLSGNDFVQTTADDLEKLSSETPQGHGVAEFAEWVGSEAFRKAMHLAPGA